MTPRGNDRDAGELYIEDLLVELGEGAALDDHELWLREYTGHQDGCPVCGGDLPVKWTWSDGDPRVAPARIYCSDACRQKAYRLRRKIQRRS